MIIIQLNSRCIDTNKLNHLFFPSLFIRYYVFFLLFFPAFCFVQLSSTLPSKNVITIQITSFQPSYFGILIGFCVASEKFSTYLSKILFCARNLYTGKLYTKMRKTGQDDGYDTHYKRCNTKYVTFSSILFFILFIIHISEELNLFLMNLVYVSILQTHKFSYFDFSKL